MRLNRFIAQATGVSRRKADLLIATGRITVNDKLIWLGYDVKTTDVVKYDGVQLELDPIFTTILLHKPIGYVCSRNGQGSPTIYDLLPKEYQSLKPVGRLDKDSSGLILLTNNGNLHQKLTHPSYGKIKRYQIELDKPLNNEDQLKISNGIELDDGISRLRLSGSGHSWVVDMQEGRNRQIRRTFEVLKYRVTSLHRTAFGNYSLGTIPLGKYRLVEDKPEN